VCDNISTCVAIKWMWPEEKIMKGKNIGALPYKGAGVLEVRLDFLFYFL
jgi:hypothetical protein